MPEGREDGVGFCFAFAATALLQQHYCEAKHGCTEEDNLSVLDVINQYAKKVKPKQNGGSSFEALRAVEKLNKVALESCANFNALFKTDKLRKYEPSTDWEEVLQQNFSDALETTAKLYIPDPRETKDCIHCGGSKTEPVIDVSDYERILSRSGSDTPFTVLVEKFVFPKQCENQRKNIAPFKPHEMRAGSIEEAKIKIHPVVESGRPIQIGVCLKENAKDMRECMGHATVISGVRQNCCGNTCKTEYKITDSMQLTWIASSTGGWVDANTLLARTELFHKGNRAFMSWIEPISEKH